jgi:hypothetical protein
MNRGEKRNASRHNQLHSAVCSLLALEYVKFWNSPLFVEIVSENKDL